MTSSCSPNRETGSSLLVGSQADCMSVTASQSALAVSNTAMPPRKPPSMFVHQAPSIGRRSSLQSLNLDDFQSTPGDPNKRIGSMNMDEILKGMWIPEEGQTIGTSTVNTIDDAPFAHTWHHNVQRQGSIPLPRTLSRKMADELWKDIADTNIDMSFGAESACAGKISGAEQQVATSEMTLEDFLLKSGLVMTQNGPRVGHTSLLSFAPGYENLYGSSVAHNGGGDKLTHTNDLSNYKTIEDEKPNINSLPDLSLSTASAGQSNQAGIRPHNVQVESLKYGSLSPRSLDPLTNGSFQSVASKPRMQQIHKNAPFFMNDVNASTGASGNLPTIGVQGNCYVGPTDLNVDLGINGLAPGMDICNIKLGSPSSPLPDGVEPSHGSMSSSSPLRYGLDGVTTGRKRGFDSSLEKVVERRQRRMIKNRESAARSRARKQAYTVELETEVLRLKEENMRLRLLQKEMADKQKKQGLGEGIATL
ncbi:hypothetical protein KP509_27G043400 [Ceratopteris richardii]|uniref:BZIP domain-containing protein n=1 Tax=Ceratopteris richardii TaxID=49495 RepID=A0A8T2RFU3_CERRI|nr:hypothetical protein KP509_27G043400 [Ceratopteris richardii]